LKKCPEKDQKKNLWSRSFKFSTAVVPANFYRGGVKLKLPVTEYSFLCIYTTVKNIELNVPQMPRISVKIFTYPPEREFMKQKPKYYRKQKGYFMIR
jgi:hypothetical protein